MFCPKCGTEYRKGFTVCSDCEVALVHEPPPEPMPEIHTTTFSKLDDRILSVVRKHYRQNLSEPTYYKLHSISTIVAVGLSINSISPFFYDGFETFGSLFTAFRVVFALLLIALYINTFYYWRVFFELRKKGLISDRNLFFSESAGPRRKLAFYVALVLDSIQVFRSRLIPTDMGESLRKIRFATRTDFIRDAGLTFFYNIILSIILVECLRLMYSKSFSWSNKKHFAVVMLITVTFSIVQLFLRYYFSGHGMLW